MAKLVELCMDEGACGMTAGLVYSPGMSCSPEEITAVAKGLVKRQGVFESHMRSESSQLLKSVKETIAVGEENGIPVQIAHHKAAGVKNWGLLRQSLQLIEEARERGVDVTFNQYPYESASTTLRAILPAWVQQGGIEALCERLQDPATRNQVEKEVLQKNCDWDNYYENADGSDGIILLCFPNTPKVEGKTLTEVAKLHKKSPVQMALELIVANKGVDTTAYKMMSEQDVLLGLSHPYGMVASDSISAPANAKSHPRGFGAFPHFLEVYVKQKKHLCLEEAIRRITSAPARRLGIMDRGLIAPGLAADLVVLNMHTLKDNSTFEHPQAHPEGLDLVVVNGVIALENGQARITGSGQVLR